MKICIYLLIRYPIYRTIVKHRCLLKPLTLLAVMSLLASCGVSDERIDAYRSAAKKVRRAASSEALELIAYDLSKELQEIDSSERSMSQIESSASEGDKRSIELLDAISEARRMFNETLSDKEKIFYIERLTEKEKK